MGARLGNGRGGEDELDLTHDIAACSGGGKARTDAEFRAFEMHESS